MISVENTQIIFLYSTNSKLMIIIDYLLYIFCTHNFRRIDSRTNDFQPDFWAFLDNLILWAKAGWIWTRIEFDILWNKLIYCQPVV